MKEDLKAKRAKIYGDPKITHEAIGLCWTGLLKHVLKDGETIGPVQVAQMMAMFKIIRARHVYHADNYRDAEVYLEFSEAWQRE